MKLCNESLHKYRGRQGRDLRLLADGFIYRLEGRSLLIRIIISKAVLW